MLMSTFKSRDERPAKMSGPDLWPRASSLEWLIHNRTTIKHAVREAKTEEEIIRLIRAGGKAMDAGTKALYGGFAQPMLRFFVYKGASSEEAKDILQDTVVKVVRSAATFSGEGAARAWIWQIARNCLTDHQRKQGSLANHETAVNDEHWEMLEHTTPDPNATSCAAPGSVDECVSAGLEQFSQREPERALVLMLQMDGLAIEEIGHQIGRTMAATKEYLSQCKKKIQPFIAHCTDLLAG
jgi:RNA polymerase sigma-70 factor (ECF subfamily)